MKNVIVVALGGSRHAIELRWVRDVFTVGHITPVPWAPPTIVGVTNFRGSILSVIDALRLLEPPESGDPADGGGAAGERNWRRGGDGEVAVILELDDLRAALRVDNVEEVSTLHCGDTDDVLVDGSGQNVPLLEPPALFARALSATLAEVEARKDSVRGR